MDIFSQKQKPLSVKTQTLDDLKKSLLAHGITLKVTRKAVKNINFRIKANTFLVSAPKYVSEFELTRIISTRTHWAVNAHNKLQQKQSHNPPFSKRILKEGDQILLWGEAVTLALKSCASNNTVNYDADKKTLTCHLKTNSLDSHTSKVDHIVCQNKIKQLVSTWYRTELTNEMHTFFEKWQPIVGKYAMEIRIKKMTTRWGSCNVNARRVWLSLYLAQYPKQCTE